MTTLAALKRYMLIGSMGVVDHCACVGEAQRKRLKAARLLQTNKPEVQVARAPGFSRQTECTWKRILVGRQIESRRNHCGWRAVPWATLFRSVSSGPKSIL